MAKDFFSRSAGAADKVFSKLDDTLGVSEEYQRVKYDSLSPDDFASIEKMYGTDNMVRFIHAQEAKRLHRGISDDN